MTCDHCGRLIDDSEEYQMTADTVVCGLCVARSRWPDYEPDHVVTGEPEEVEEPTELEDCEGDAQGRFDINRSEYDRPEYGGES